MTVPDSTTTVRPSTTIKQTTTDQGSSLPCVQHNYEFYGSVIINIDRVPEWRNCESICRDNKLDTSETCEMWTWKPYLGETGPSSVTSDTGIIGPQTRGGISIAPDGLENKGGICIIMSSINGGRVTGGVVSGRKDCQSGGPASTSTTPLPSTTLTRDCPESCPIEFRKLICASNGEVYGNECSFKKYKCESGNQDIKVVDCPDHCYGVSCPAQSRCMPTIQSGPGYQCRCDPGRYLETIEGDDPTCRSSTRFVKVQNMRLNIPFLPEYNDLDSPSAMALILFIESVITDVFRGTSDQVVKRIEVTSLSPGSVVVNMNVHTSSSAVAINDLLIKAASDGSLASIGVDSSTKITTQDSKCRKGQFLRDGRCKPLKDYMLGRFTLIDKQTTWNNELQNHDSAIFKNIATKINNGLDAVLENKVSLLSLIRPISVVEEFERSIDGNTLASGYIVHTGGLVSGGLIGGTAKKRLCEELNDAEFEYSTFFSNECCYYSVIGEENFQGVYEYPTSLVNTTIVKNCKFNPKVTFERRCLLDGMVAQWEDLMKDTLSIPVCAFVDETVEELKDLNDLSEDEICDNDVQNSSCVTVVEVSQNLSAITTKKKIESSFEVIFVSNIVENIANKADQVKKNLTKSTEVLDNTMKAVSRVLDTDVVKVQIAEDKDSSATDMIVKVEQLSKALGEAVVTESEPIIIETPNIAARIAKIPDDSDYEVIVQDGERSEELSILDDDSKNNKPSTPEKESLTRGRISIPKATFRNVEGGFDGKVYTFAYRKYTIFRSKIKSQNDAVGSIVVSVSLQKKVEGSPAVRIRFQNKNESDGVSCNYWETVKERTKKINRTRGFWDTRGCRVENIDGDDVTCACDHFTNFALLLTAEGVDVPPELKIFSTIGNAISFVALFFTILAHASIKKLRKTLPSKILICFSIALSFLLLFLLVEEHAALTSKVSCQVIAALIHFSMLSTFTWTSVNALCLYQAIVKIFNARDNRVYMIRASVFAWGVPAIIVIVNGAVEPGSLGRFTDDRNVCFPQGPSMLYGGILPVAITLLINAITFITIMVSLLRRPEVGVGRKRDIKKQTRIAVCCVVLLGIAWIFGLLVSIDNASLVFQILFCVFNAIQGLAVLMLYTLRNPNVKAELKRLSGCASTDTTGSSSASGASNQHHKTQKEIASSTTSSNNDTKKEIPNSTYEYPDVGLQNLGAQTKERPTYDGPHIYDGVLGRSGNYELNNYSPVRGSSVKVNCGQNGNYTTLGSQDNPIYQSIEEYGEPQPHSQQPRPSPRPSPRLPQRQPPPPPSHDPSQVYAEIELENNSFLGTSSF